MLLIELFKAIASGVERAWEGCKRVTWPVLEPPLRPLTRRVERMVEASLRRERDKDLALAAELEAVGMPDSARRLRELHA